MTKAIALQQWVGSEMQRVEAQWSVGTFGAIAEFSRDAEEPASVVCNDLRAQVVTRRGGIRIFGLENARAFAYETISKDPDQWSHAVALSLPVDDCAMNRCSALTELGKDGAALRDEDRDGVLFDLGLGTLQVDVCIRTSDPELLDALRAGAGRALFEPGNPAMPAILKTSPHRVFETRIGRVEVYQPIPSADKQSPNGPHTHLLPKLLRSGRTHAATVPIPSGWVPCAHLYPVHPRKDGSGRAKPFDRTQHERFQNILGAYGDRDFIDLKQRVLLGVESGDDPAELGAPTGRFANAAIRVALRQSQALNGSSPSLVRWRQIYDRVVDAADDEDEQAQH
jgi:hypothetical protein